MKINCSHASSSSLSTLLLRSSFRVSETFSLSSVAFALNLCLFSIEFLLRSRRRYIDLRRRCAQQGAHFSHELGAVGLAAQVKHSTIHIVQVLLLWAEDGARPRNSDPTDESRRWETEMLHAVQTN